MKSVWGPVIALIWVEIQTMKKKIYIIQLGLRWPPIDYFTHNNKPKTWKRVRRGGANIRELVGTRHSIDLSGDSDNEKKAKI